MTNAGQQQRQIDRRVPNERAIGFVPGKLDNAYDPITYDGQSSDRSMANPAFVGDLVRELALKVVDIRKRYNDPPAGSDPAVDAIATITVIADVYTQRFSAANTSIAQRMTPDVQRKWLIMQGYGSADDRDAFDEPVHALVTSFIERVVTALIAGETGAPEDQQHFLIDTAIEDCTMALLGFRNSGA